VLEVEPAASTRPGAVHTGNIPLPSPAGSGLVCLCGRFLRVSFAQAVPDFAQQHDVLWRRCRRCGRRFLAHAVDLLDHHENDESQNQEIQQDRQEVAIGEHGAERLDAAGMVMLGRANMDEFAMGSSTEHSAYGPTKNPRDPERVPGGSSGGSAAAVAGDLCVAALGSDTGGSIRQPAAFCGIVGMKPTYGRVSRSGVMAMASSLDQIGPMTKTAEDAAILLQAIEGQDPLDQTTAATQAYSLQLTADSIKGLKIGLPRQAWGEGMTAGVREHAEEATRKLRALGASVIDVDLPYADEALAVYYVLMPCEVSANLARFDGMRYGMREAAENLFATYAESRGRGLGEEVRRRVMLGTYALSKGYYDAYYRQARKVQTLIRRAYDEAFKQVDLLVTPTAPSTAFKIGEKTSDPLAMYLEDVFTVGVNVAGLPAVSIPCGLHEGLPVGLQLIGPRFEDGRVLSVAHAFEKA